MVLSLRRRDSKSVQVGRGEEGQVTPQGEMRALQGDSERESSKTSLRGAQSSPPQSEL